MVSVSDKTGLSELAELLSRYGVQVVSTGRTCKELSKLGYKDLHEIKDITNFPEILDGRVKTLHPAVHSAILARKDNSTDLDTLKQHKIEPFDLIVLNLYPFQHKWREQAEQNQDKPPSPEQIMEMVEQIDIGGITLLRAAAKNYQSIALITDPLDYEALAEELKKNNGGISQDFTKQRMAAAFAKSSEYDNFISHYFSHNLEDTDIIARGFQPLTQADDGELRYGENPHQRAVLFKNISEHGGVAQGRLLAGRVLSYNNILDANAAWGTVLDLPSPACVVVKHSQPCAAVWNSSQATACDLAFAADKESFFGGILAFNTEIEEGTAAILKKHFIEVVVAPSFSGEALAILSSKKNLRLLACDPLSSTLGLTQTKSIGGGFLRQEQDSYLPSAADLKWVTRIKLEVQNDIADLLFAWKLAKHCISNAIVIAKSGQSLGIGAGQTSRVFSVEIAMLRARKNGLDTKDAVVASDAFFPFPDSIEILAAAGIKAIIQPGGSKNDPDVIAAADKHSLAMAFTGKRCFYHG